jgi:hypothetical protein
MYVWEGHEEDIAGRQTCASEDAVRDVMWHCGV